MAAERDPDLMLPFGGLRLESEASTELSRSFDIPPPDCAPPVGEFASGDVEDPAFFTG